MPLRASEYTGDLRDAVSHLTEARRLGGEKLSTPAAPRIEVHTTAAVRGQRMWQ